QPDVEEYQEILRTCRNFLFQVGYHLNRQGVEFLKAGQLFDAQNAYANAYKIFSHLDRVQPGVKDYQKNREASREDLAKVGQDLNNQGIDFAKAGEFPKAAAALQVAVATFEPLANDQPQDPRHLESLGSGYFNLGNVFKRQGQLHLAASAHE